MEHLTNPQWIAGVLTLLGTLGAFIKWVWPFVKRCFDSMFGHTEINEKLDRLAELVEKMSEELITNGGSSIKDSMIRMEKDVTLIGERARGRWLDDKDMMFETDNEGNCIWVNRTYARTVQRLPNELLGHGWRRQKGSLRRP